MKCVFHRAQSAVWSNLDSGAVQCLPNCKVVLMETKDSTITYLPKTSPHLDLRLISSVKCRNNRSLDKVWGHDRVLGFDKTGFKVNGLHFCVLAINMCMDLGFIFVALFSQHIVLNNLSIFVLRAVCNSMWETNIYLWIDFIFVYHQFDKTRIICVIKKAKASNSWKQATYSYPLGKAKPKLRSPNSNQ